MSEARNWRSARNHNIFFKSRLFDSLLEFRFFIQFSFNLHSLVSSFSIESLTPFLFTFLCKIQFKKDKIYWLATHTNLFSTFHANNTEKERDRHTQFLELIFRSFRRSNFKLKSSTLLVSKKHRKLAIHSL